MPSGKLTRRFLLSTLWPALVFALASGPPGSPAASQPRRLSESSGNTTISFFNVGACAAVAAVKIEFRNVGGLNGICPRTYRASGGRCHIPGPYGREVYISLWGTVSYLDITLLNPAEDDVNLTTPERVYISPDQRRNFVGIYVRPGSTPLTCGSGFTVLSDGFDAGDVAPGYFRSVFRNAALDVGSADVISNQDSTITTLQEAQSFAIDQLLVTTQDMPNPVGISFATENAGTAVYVPGGNLPAGAVTAPIVARRWGSTCERTATGFVLYGRLPAIPMQILRLDGAGTQVCSYAESETGKFTAEVAFYNTVAGTGSLVFAYGLSPFLPYTALQTSQSLSWTQRGLGSSTQPGELWVKVVDAVTGGVVVLSQRVPIVAQRRNLVGVSLGACATCLQIDLLQADNETHTAPPVELNHFRLIFAHAALTLPGASVIANDDITLMNVAPGARGYLDHPLLPPHQSGRLLKISFDTGGHSSNTFSTMIDISALCDGAAYGVVLMGTLDRLDLYDPILVTVGGTSTACSLSTASVDAGTTSSLAMMNAAAHSVSVRFEWGQTLLALTRRSVALPFGGHDVTDVPVGSLFVRLLHPLPPYEPLTPIMVVHIHHQSRNAIVASASGLLRPNGLPQADSQLSWRLEDLTSVDTVIGATSVRAHIFNAFTDEFGVDAPVGAAVSGAMSQSLSLSAGGHQKVDYPVDGGLSIAFADGATALGEPAQIAFGEACAQSLQLVVIAGRRGEVPPVPPLTIRSVDLSPRAIYVDGAAGVCNLVLVPIPDKEAEQAATTQPPTTTSTLDIFGEGGPGDGGLIASAGPPRLASPRVLLSLLLICTASLIVAR